MGHFLQFDSYSKNDRIFTKILTYVTLKKEFPVKSGSRLPIRTPDQEQIFLGQGICSPSAFALIMAPSSEWSDRPHTHTHTCCTVIKTKLTRFGTAAKLSKIPPPGSIHGGTVAPSTCDMTAVRVLGVMIDSEQLFMCYERRRHASHMRRLRTRDIKVSRPLFGLGGLVVLNWSFAFFRY